MIYKYAYMYAFIFNMFSMFNLFIYMLTYIHNTNIGGYILII